MEGECGMTDKLQDRLAYPPRGMNADRAAAYCGVSRSKFLELVEADTLPQPRDLGGLPRWDRAELDAAFDALAARERKPGARRSFDDLMATDNAEEAPGLRSRVS